jgi:hypothetical protein
MRNTLGEVIRCQQQTSSGAYINSSGINATEHFAWNCIGPNRCVVFEGIQARDTVADQFPSQSQEIESSQWVREMLAGAGGIKPPNGGIKISVIIQQFQSVFGKKHSNASQ